MILLREAQEFLVHRQIEHPVHQKIGAGAQRRLGDDQLGRVHREALARRVRGIAGGLHDRLLRREVVALLVDEPHLDVVRLAIELARDELTCSLGRGDCHDRRVAEIELRTLDHRNQGPCDRHARRSGGEDRTIAHVEVPERPADVHDARDSACEPDLEGRVEPRLVARDFLRVRHDGVEVRDIRASIEVA